MKKSSTPRQRILGLGVPLSLLVLAALACGSGGGEDEAANLEATANALNAQATQLAQQPTQPPPEPAQPAQEQPAQEQPPQGGGSVPLELVNQAAMDVCYVQISPTTAEEWGEDWLGETEIVAPGSSRTFEVQAGRYDLRASDCDGNDIAIEWEVDLSSGSYTWTLSGGGFFYDDFSTEDTSAWEIWPGSEVYGGEFHLGQFADCADVGSNDPYGCFSQCVACGTVSEYDMAAYARYVDGVTDRTFGLVLRFVDQNGNGLVDPNDYYLDFELSIWDQYFIIWEHLDNGTWNVLAESFESSIAGSHQTNHLRAVAYNGGSDIDIYINGTNVWSVTGLPYSEGAVGLAVGGRALEVAYDDFSITAGP